MEAISIIHGGEVNHIGFDVAIDGDNIVTTAKDLNGDLYAYLFKISDPDYVNTLSLSYGGSVGYNLPSIDIEGDYIALGSEFDSMDLDENAGAVYLLKISDESFERRITSDTQMAYDYFGSSVDITGDYIAIGAMGRGNNEGRVYLYSISQNAIVKEYQESSDGDLFGFTVALSEDMVYVGTGTSNYLKTFNKLSGYKVEITDENTQTVLVTKDGVPYTMMDNFIDENLGIFVVEATDIAGNVGSGILNLDPPVLDNLDGLIVYVDSLTPTLSANKEFKYRLEGSGDWSELSSGLSLVIPSGLSEGSTGIYVQAANGATSELHYVGVDTIAPVFTVDFIASEEYGNKFRINVTETNKDSIVATSASGMYQLQSSIDIVDDGTYEITVTDKAGNVTSGVYECDLIAPIIQNTSGLVETSGITISADENFVSISTDSGLTWVDSAGTTSHDLTNLAEGTYEVKVKDSTGNVSDAYVVKVNAITPTILNTETLIQDDVTITTNEEIKFVQIDGTDWIEGSGTTHDFIGLEDGTHTIIFKDVTDIESAQYTFTVDTVAPVISASGVATVDGTLVINTSGLTISTDEDFVSIKPDALSDYTEISATSTYDFSSLSNDQQLRIRVKDAAGNESEYKYVYVDTELSIAVSETSTAGTFRVDVTSDEYTSTGHSGYLHIVIMSGVTEICNEDNVAGTQYFSSNCQMSVEATYDITVTDLAGHTATLQFELDTKAPTILSPTEQSYSSGVINILTDEDFVAYSLNDGTSWTSVDGTSDLTVNGLTDGSTLLKVKDAAGNESIMVVVYVKTSATTITHVVNSGEYEVYTVDEYRQLESWIVTKDGNPFETVTRPLGLTSYSSEQPYGDGSFGEQTLDQPGDYVITAVDRYGFTMTYSFTIPTPPA